MGIAGPPMNSYTGGLSINEGTVVVSHNLAAGITGAIRLGGGAIETSGGNLLANPVTLVDATTSQVTGSFQLALGGVVSGSGALNVNADDAAVIALQFQGGAANTQSGAITIVNGGLNLNKTAGINAVAGSLVVGDGVGDANSAFLQQAANEQIPNAVPVTIASDGRWQLSLGSRTETISNLTLIGGGRVDTGGGTLTVNNLTLIGGGRVETGTGALIVNDSITVSDGAAAHRRFQAISTSPAATASSTSPAASSFSSRPASPTARSPRTDPGRSTCPPTATSPAA